MPCTSSVPPKSHALAGYAACALAGVLWGTGFYFGKIALTGMSVEHMVLYRFLFSCLVLAPLAVRHPARLAPRDWRALLLAALLGVPVQFLVQFVGLSMTTVTHASLMVGSMPVLLAVAATLFAHERVSPLGWLALAASSSGVVLIVLGGHAAATGGRGPSIFGDLLVVFSLMIALFWVLVNQRLVRRYPPVTISAYGLLTGTAMLAVWVVTIHGLPPVRGVARNVWLALAASGVLCTACTTLLWNWGMRHVPASRAGIFMNLEPLVGSLLGVCLLGDRLSPVSWIGGVLILGSAVVSTVHGHGQQEPLVGLTD
ncbi:MAG: EamA family transporter [Acidobacteriota bacterium]|nr:EamA family transporter [Acidobacteriota bacterium]